VQVARGSGGGSVCKLQEGQVVGACASCKRVRWWERVQVARGSGGGSVCKLQEGQVAGACASCKRARWWERVQVARGPGPSFVHSQNVTFYTCLTLRGQESNRIAFLLGSCGKK
jgi:hypothetical protein